MSANVAEKAEMSRNKMDSRFHGNDEPDVRNGRPGTEKSQNSAVKKGRKRGRKGIWDNRQIKYAAIGMLRIGVSRAGILHEIQRMFGLTVSNDQVCRLAKALKERDAAKESESTGGTPVPPEEDQQDRMDSRFHGNDGEFHHRDTEDTEKSKLHGNDGHPTPMPEVAPDEALHYTRNPDGSVEISVREPQIVTTYPGDGSVEISMAHPFPNFNPHPAFQNIKNRLVAELTLRPDLPGTIKEMLTQQPAGRCAFGVTQSKYSCFHRQVLSGIKRKVRGHKGAMMLNAMYLGCKGCGNFLTQEEYDWVITALNEARKSGKGEIAA